MIVTATLKNWTIVKAGGSLYLKGYAYNHVNPDYAKNGDLILSSQIWEGLGGFVYCADGLYKLEG
jgi:hypothetical protein